MDKKNTQHTEAQGMNEHLSNAHSTDTGTTAQAKPTRPRTQAECERALSPTQATALRLTRTAQGTNDIEALEKHGLGNFIQRKCEAQNLGFVFAEELEKYTDLQGVEHPRMIRFRFLEWRMDMIGCKDKSKAQADLDNANQLDLFALESA